MRGYFVRSGFTLLILSALAVNALGGGFQHPFQSAQSMGLGGCGTGLRMGAASAFLNPGAMSFLEHSTASLGASFYTKNASYLSPFGGNTDQEKSFLAPLHGYGVIKLNDEKSAVGLSINQPFGFSTHWPSDWTGRYLVTESDLSTWYFQPSFSYKLGESFSAGAGVVFGLSNRTLTRKINASGLTGTEVEQEFDGSGSGFGFNLGLYYEVEEEFSIGLTYRSAVKMSLSGGSVSYSNVPASLETSYPSGTSFDGDITMPSVLSLGGAYMPIRELSLTAEVSFTGWSAADEISFDTDETPSLGYESGWVMDNTLSFRFGAQYEVSEKISVRAGAALDPSPVPDDHVTPELPDADRFTGGLGLTVHFSETFSADLSFATENTREREIKNEDLSFDGTYKTIYNHFGFTVNLDF